MGSWARFGLLFLGVTVMFLGAGSWFPLHDTDYGYDFDYATENPESAPADLQVYSVLSEEQQRVVDRAMNEGPQRLETRDQQPPAAVRKNGTYYVFKAYAYFDWTSPRTFGPTLVGVLGVAMVVEAIRRDVRS